MNSRDITSIAILGTIAAIAIIFLMFEPTIGLILVGIAVVTAVIYAISKSGGSIRLNMGRNNLLPLLVTMTAAIAGIIIIFTFNLFANLSVTGLFIFVFILLSAMIYLYTSDEKGPMGLRGRYPKPFVLASVLMVIGVMIGFMIYFNAGQVLDLIGQIPLAAGAAGLGILFGMAAFLKLYRKDL